MPKSQMARVYLNRFPYHEACLGVLLLPPGRDASLLQGYPQPYVAGAHLKQWTKVPCLRKQCDRRGLNPGPPDPLGHSHASTDKLKQTKGRLVEKTASYM